MTEVHIHFSANSVRTVIYFDVVACACVVVVAPPFIRGQKCQARLTVQKAPQRYLAPRVEFSAGRLSGISSSNQGCLGEEMDVESDASKKWRRVFKLKH